MTRWGAQPRFPDKKESIEGATIRLKMLLAGCTDQALAGFTVDHLVATHRVSAKTAEYELLMARNRRSGAIR